jgi:thiamine biosynthesis lipoprotein
MKLIITLLCMSLLLTVSGCRPNPTDSPQTVTRSAFVMDTIATFTVYAAQSDDLTPALDKAIERLHELESLFDHTNPSSELSRINMTAHSERVTVSEDMGVLIAEGLRLSELTGGAFDISLGMLITMEAVPPQVLPNLGYEHIIYDSQNRTVEFTSSIVALNFGAIAKGYAVDEVLRILTEHGVTSAIIDIGGEIGVTGQSQRADGVWRVGINDPYTPGEIIEVYELKSGVMATSGTYERGDHIFDRTTGRPADSGLASVTVIADSGTIADALSTAIFVMGIQSEKAQDLIEKTGIHVIFYDYES